jgi:lipoprotein-anchoring transpeptidase ErfK/SrfK
MAAVKLAAIYVKEGDKIEARNTLSAALRGLPEGAERQKAVDQLDILNGELIFSRKESADSITYEVKQGDRFVNIAKQYNVPYEFIKRINYLTSDDLRIGDRLKIIPGPFDVIIEKSRFRLTVYRGGIYVKEYRIGLGKDGTTPEGDYAVTLKLKNPVWNPEGPEYAAAGASDNPLGTRWIEFVRHYGIHGTTEPDSIGKEESRGCIRMLNADVEELYDLLVPGSKVSIVP